MENTVIRNQPCTNCGITNHLYRNCISPVTSYGVIAIRYMNTIEQSPFSKNITVYNDSNSIQYLLIQRKDSLAFVEFIRGKYNHQDEEYIGRLLRGMAHREHEQILSHTFDELWQNVWGESFGVKSHKSDHDNSSKKYALISDKLRTLIENNPTKWTEPEWGFPKGRRNPYESDMSCACREFQEETGILCQDFTIIQNTYPISETFFGSNQVHYCHKYYIALCNTSVDVKMNTNNPHMAREIGGIQWCSLDDAISKIRPDNVEKREILLKAGKIMRNFHPVHINELPRSLYHTS